MASEFDLSFECPQFVDFATEVDSSGKDDLFFDCKDHQSPDDKSKILSSINLPPVPVKEKYPSEVEENRLLEKMEASLSIINTPKFNVSVIKRKLLAEDLSKKVCSVKPTLKPVAARLLATDLHRSKSTVCLSKICTENVNKIKGFRKRSSSLNDLRSQKKQTYPLTPMCLKRTIIKAKDKIVKSSEEMELETIAQLQRQMKAHLRFNEQTFKKLKLKARPCVIAKNTTTKGENLKDNRGMNPSVEELNLAEKRIRKTRHTLKHNDLMAKAARIDNIMKNQPLVHKNTNENETRNDLRQPQCPSTSSFAGAEVSEKNKNQVIKVINKKIGFHSGIIFHGTVKNNLAMKPFNYKAKIKERIESAGDENKPLLSLSSSTVKCKVNGKENIPSYKAHSSVKKLKDVQSFKWNVQELASNKKIVEKHFRNPLRGLLVSENSARK